MHIKNSFSKWNQLCTKIEGGSGIYVEEDVEVGDNQIITSDIAPLSGTNMVTVGTDGILTSQAIPSLSSQWTSSGSDMYNNNSGDVLITSGSKLGIGIGSPDYSLDVSGNGRIDGYVGIGIAPDNTNTYLLKVNGSTRVSGDIEIVNFFGSQGNLSVGGNATVAGTATITGATTISGATTIKWCNNN